MEQTLINAHAVLKTTPIRWASLAGLLPAGLIERKPAPGEWSAVECLQHIIDVERLFQFRLQAFLEGRPEFPAFDPDAGGGPQSGEYSASEKAAEFGQLRDQSLEIIGSLTPEDLQRGSRHAELGPVTLAEMVNEWAAHDLNHTVQAERALMQPFIEKSGPWQRYFTEHFIS